MFQSPLLIATFIKNEKPSISSQKVSSPTKYLTSSIRSLIGTDLNSWEVSSTSNEPEGLDNVVKFIDPLILNDTNGKCSLVTWRGILTKIMTNEPITLLACKYKNVLFVRESTEGRRKSSHFHPAEKWGRAFEKLFVESSIKEEHELGCVFKSRLGGTKLIYGAEIDCVDENGKFIELKTSRVLGNEVYRNGPFVERKMPKFWAQCYLVGIESLLVGFRDDFGVVKDLQFLATREMQSHVPHKEMIERLERFILCITKEIVESGLLNYYKIQGTGNTFECIQHFYQNINENCIVPSILKN